MALIDRIKQQTDEQKTSSLISKLRAEKEPEVSSPLLETPAPPSPQLTEEQLKTMEYEGLPITTGPGATPSPFIAEPAEGIGAGIEDVAEAVAHLAKGAVALPAVGMEMLARGIGAALGGADIDEALATAQEAGQWLGPGPQTRAAEVIESVATIPRKISEKVVTEAPPGPPTSVMAGWAKAHAEKIAAAKRTAGVKFEEPFIPKSVMEGVSIAAKTAIGTAIELGLYALVGRLVHGAMRGRGRAKITTADVEKIGKKIETRLRKGGYTISEGQLRPEARELADAIMKEMGIEKPREPEIIYKTRKESMVEPEITGEAPVAEFKEFQRTAEGELVPYFNVGKDTMTAEGLARRGIPVPEIVDKPYEGMHPGTPGWLRLWNERPELHKDMAEYARELQTEEFQPTEVEVATPVDPPPVQTTSNVLEKILEDVPEEYKPLASGKPRPVQVDKSIPIVREREGMIPAEEQVKVQKAREFERKPREELTEEERAEALAAGEEARAEFAERERETTIGETRVEAIKSEKEIVTMENVHKEAEKILADSKDLNELAEKMQELVNRYENNLDVGFGDPFEAVRYVEWGDEIMTKINQARRQQGLIEEPPPEIPPDETFGFGGTGDFQKVYEAFVDRFKKRAAEGGRKIGPEVKEILDKGEIVSQRKVKGRYRPPIYRAYLEVLKDSRKLPETFLRRGFENPIRTFEEAGGEALLDLTTHRYHAREAGVIKLQKALKKSRDELFKGVSAKARRRVGTYAIDQQKGGRIKLREAGIKEKDIPTKLSPKEQALYDTLRDRFESWYRRLSNLRESIGKDPFPKTDDYFTFIRNFTLLERAGFRPLDMPSDVLDAQFTKMGATPFKFARPRTNAIYSIEVDPLRILELYEDSAARHVQMSPFIALMRELQSGIKDPETGARFRLVNENPVLARSLHSWTNHIAGMKSPTFQLPPAVENIMMRVNSNLAASILGANVRSAMIQISALRNTVAEIGFYHTTKGILSLVDPKARNFALKKSKVLSQRTYDVTVEDALRRLKGGKLLAAKRLGAKAAMKPLQILDMETAKATWQGAYDYARGKLKLNERRAINYADDVVTRTQASAMPGDIAPVQRSVVGKFFTLFQTFTINDWDFLVKDVVGVRRGGPLTKRSLARAMRYVAATTLFNSLFEDVLHIQTPFPNPIQAFRESLDNGDSIPSLAWNVGSELIEPIPIVGAARYGKGPGGPGSELLAESVKFVRQDPAARPWWELGGKWIGVPGTAQIGKTVRAKKRGESQYGQIVGTYTRPSKPLKTLQGLRQKSGIRSLE